MLGALFGAIIDTLIRIFLYSLGIVAIGFIVVMVVFFIGEKFHFWD